MEKNNCPQIQSVSDMALHSIITQIVIYQRSWNRNAIRYQYPSPFPHRMMKTEPNEDQCPPPLPPKGIKKECKEVPGSSSWSRTRTETDLESLPRLFSVSSNGSDVRNSVAWWWRVEA